MKFGLLFFVGVSVFLLSAVTASNSPNPFAGRSLFVNPDYVSEVDETIRIYPKKASLLEKAKNISVAYWVDRIAKVPNVTRVLQMAQKQQSRSSQQVAVAFVIYDLPNRDCAAAASNGEIHCEDSKCAQGLNTYKTQYIDPIVAAFSKYPSLQIITIVEPDSLPNLATNLAIPKCQQAQTAYIEGVAYTLAQLSKLPNVAIYIDCAHGGWLGWENNRKGFANIIQKVLSLAGNPDFRGFVSNTANYQALGSANSSADPCKLSNQGNKAIDEVHFVQLLSQTMESVGISNKKFVIDTSRNAAPATERQDCSNWCNIKNAGMGYRPTIDTTEITGLDIIDALYWVKVPGESDGTSDTSSPRFDFHCHSQDSIIPAPEAGFWFASYFLMLAENANPALE